MNKAEFVDAIAKEAGITKKDAAAAVDAYSTVVGKTLKKGDKITLIGFGTFETVKRAARTGRNPQDGSQIKIPASTSAKFKPGKGLKDMLSKKK